MKAKLFTATSNTSCRKAIAWLNEYNIPYTEKNISVTPITVEEIQEILSLTDEGTEEIISKKAYAIKKLKVDLDTLSMPELFDRHVFLFYPFMWEAYSAEQVAFAYKGYLDRLFSEEAEFAKVDLNIYFFLVKLE